MDKLAKQDILTYTGEACFDKGLWLYEDGQCQLSMVGKNQASGSVCNGPDDYTLVKIEFDPNVNNQRFKGLCECDQFRESHQPCKHISALGHAVRNWFISNPSLTKSPNSSTTPSEPITLQNVKGILNSFSKDELINTLYRIYNDNPQLMSKSLLNK
ncbi:hypothetical protein DFA_03566 [Cavenderia fasciculata]|uniref:SWIM-type domain-containing protein n=1 Tax=Cavenderia fasciculata TaxID=261658 RepID=F4PI34_CACFS|nr:uncharacterized protein DFA_03566 [Cavenderia fasciculata]EGG25317.1 hypothetical protein DFA_03566 [Cavenderia fasciculata]|eukprot:XP_004363168.1 hypothetical protein DFA_03566 [Cavenderia fasciculata]